MGLRPTNSTNIDAQKVLVLTDLHVMFYAVPMGSYRSE